MSRRSKRKSKAAKHIGDLPDAVIIVVSVVVSVVVVVVAAGADCNLNSIITNALSFHSSALATLQGA